MAWVTWALAWVAAWSLAAFAAALLDKRAASRHARRVPERTLLGLGLVGGSPGLLAAMLLVRHKTAKGAFLLGFALVLVAQGALVALWLGWRPGGG